MELHNKLIHAVTEYDRKQEKRKYYNRYALPQYIARVQEITEDIQNGADPRAAIIAGFTGRLQDVCLKAAGLAKGTNAECRGDGSPICYVPVSER